MIRWEQMCRYKAIELIALWEGRLTTKHLMGHFGIGRQQASKDIKVYLNEIAPNNLIYDVHLKGYRPTPHFLPQVTEGYADEYLSILLDDNPKNVYRFHQSNAIYKRTISVQPITRNIDPLVLRPLIQAIRDKKRVDISYTRLKDGENVERIISPHTLICTHLRWHVRAYCEHAKGYRDFVLSRIHDRPEINGDANYSSLEDRLWNEQVTIEIEPDTRLNEKQKAIIAKDYAMENNVLTIRTNASLIKYVLDAYNIDLHTQKSQPQGQQIIVKNLDELKKYLMF